MKKNNLSNRLLYLSTSTLSRIEMWLVYKDFKKAATIPLRNKFTDKNVASKRIKKWLDDANIFYVVDERHKDMLHISKDKNLAEKMNKLQWSDDPKDIVFRGLQYGYPKEAVYVFSKNIDKMGKAPKNDWWEYVRYRVRRGYEYEDSLVGKKWAKIIRKDLPKLAQWFENEMKKTK